MLSFARLQIWVRILLIYLAGGAVAGVLISGSRGGYLSIGVGLLGLLVYGIYHSIRVAPSRFRQLLLGSIGAGCLALLLGFSFVTGSDLMVRRFGSIVEPRDLRPLLWQAALKEFALNPVIGTGAGTYLVYGRKFRDPSVQTDPVYTHNDYLQLLAEYGAAGGVLCIGFLASHLLNAWLFTGRMLRWLQEKHESFSSSLGLVVGASLGVIALTVHSFFDFNLQIPGNTLFIAFLFGILANPGVHWSKEEKPDRFITWVRRAVPVLLGVVLIVAIWPRCRGEDEAEAARLAFLKRSYALTIYHARKAIEYGNEDPDTFYYLAESRRQLGSQFTGTSQRDLLSTAADV